jgi:hypothetical protein
MATDDSHFVACGSQRRIKMGGGVEEGIRNREQRIGVKE